MTEAADIRERLSKIASETDAQRAQARARLLKAVGEASDRGLTQMEIARSIGRSQPEVSRLIRTYRAAKFRPSSRLGRLLNKHRDEIVAIAKAHNASNVRVFGSVARGEDEASSDIDLLVDLAPDADLLDVAGLMVDLERLLGHPVDVVPARMLKPRVAPSALQDAVAL
jgi:predicted nucleotidyltransferase/predicted XRE-type DNA-binding protein